MIGKVILRAMFVAGLGCGEALIGLGNAWDGGLIDEVFSRRNYPSAPFGKCEGIAEPEREKFDECRLEVEFERDRQRNEMRQRAQEAAELREEATWAWLNSQPTGDCAAIPDTEYRKFFCLSEEDRQRQEISRVLERIKTARDGFEVQIRRLVDRELRLQAEVPPAPSPDQQRRIDLIEDIEAEIGLIGAKRRLLENLSAGFVGEAASSPPERIVYGRARANTPVYAEPDIGGRPRGRLQDGELVLILEYGFSDPVAGVISQNGDFGFVERISVSELRE